MTPSDVTAEIAERVSEWFRDNARPLPWREPDFPAWGTLVSEFMLQQTPVARVVPRLQEWLARWPTPAALAAEPAGEAVRAWNRLGYPRRALYLHECAVIITRDHAGIVPDDVDTLLTLPGVGDYTARAVASFAYARRHPVVDTNVRRVLARAVRGVEHPGPPRIRVDLAAMEDLLPSDPVEAQTVNAAVMELGAIVCTARAPRCERCPVSDLCAWRAAGFPEFTGTRAPVQKKFAGSDRQVRGLLLARVRDSQGPISVADAQTVWSDAPQVTRALSGLHRDGLVVIDDGLISLPQ